MRSARFKWQPENTFSRAITSSYSANRAEPTSGVNRCCKQAAISRFEPREPMHAPTRILVSITIFIGA
uniref:Uncharacterized protein n=1 Tax=Siphoviridae sp. ctEeW6 TaxID=2827816 RepID=A0A8S5T2A1_9CAUD|nr:MAG TPA: hypothetical protein [Siphoviridae sp. ctEeW6]